MTGRAWEVVAVSPDDLRLVDRTGLPKLGTTDPRARTVYLSNELRAPLVDKVLMHEVAHAATFSYGLLDELGSAVPEASRIAAEEWAARLVEDHGIEAARIASEILGRPVCVRGDCYGEP